MSNWASMELKVNLKVKTHNEACKLFEPVKEFCEKHSIEVRGIFFEGKNYMLVNIQVEGLTSRYCRGCTHEIKQMLREIYKCKIETLLEAY